MHQIKSMEVSSTTPWYCSSQPPLRPHAPCYSCSLCFLKVFQVIDMIYQSIPKCRRKHVA